MDGSQGRHPGLRAGFRTLTEIMVEMYALRLYLGGRVDWQPWFAAVFVYFTGDN
jgi:hypothetical protein